MKAYKFTTSFTYEGKRYKVRADDPVELGMKKARKLDELKTARRILSGDMTLTEWAGRCIPAYKTGQGEETRRKFEARVRSCILDVLGDYPLKKIRPLDVQDCMNRQTGMSPTQVSEVYYALKFLFRKAYTNRLIAVDPAEDLEKPKAKPREHRRALTPEEREHFIRVGLTDRRFLVFLLMLGCGCRPSEASMAQGRDLSVRDGVPVLHIRGTKTKSADRDVPIPPWLWEAVKDTPPFEYIAPTATGHIIDQSQRRRIWKAYCRAINIDMGAKLYRNALVPPLPLAPDLVPYCLRHEYCTDLARRGVDIRIAQKLMGHSTISLTADIYTNLSGDDVAAVGRDLYKGEGCPTGCPTQPHQNAPKRAFSE